MRTTSATSPSRSSALLQLLSVLALLLGSGCDDDLPEATLIERMRVLGSRFEVVGDETRASPKPGERLHVSLATVFDTTAKNIEGVSSMVIQCTAPDQYTGGVPICQEFLDAARLSATAEVDPQLEDDVTQLLDEGFVLSCGDLGDELFEFEGVSLRCLEGAPETTIGIPGGFRANEALLLGVVCERGKAVLDPTLPTLMGCDDENTEGIHFSALIPVQHDPSVENQNPPLDALTLNIDGGQWERFERDEFPPEGDCSSSAPKSGYGLDLRPADPGDHAIRISLRDDVREALEEGRENMEVVIHATAGDMERRFTLFQDADLDDPDPEVDDGDPDTIDKLIEWEPPSPALLNALEVAKTGMLVRFFVTLRDGRGGFDMASYALCVY
ncbi:MAG: hypothetical protein OEZ06_08545 [Myxococcales bacterium]|nr:hypothetical protein [Myxococcales bacterium]